MSDGAHLGISAKRAIDTILGGEPAPTEDEEMPIGDFFVWLLGDDQPMDYAVDGGAAYNECARRAGREVLRFFLADPSRALMPADTEYDWDGDPDRGAEGMKSEFVKALGVYDAMKAAGIDLGPLELSGFQWGWAVNAARRCVDLGPVANPAIMTIELPDTPEGV